MTIGDKIVRGVKASLVEKVVRMAVQGLIILLLTRVFLSPGEYGTVFLAVSIFSIAIIFGSLGIPKSTARYIAEFRETQPENVRPIVRTSIIVQAIPLAIVSVGFVTFAGPIADVFDDPRLYPLLLIGGGYIAFKTATGYLAIVFQGFGRIVLSAATNVIAQLGQLTAIILLLAFGFGVIGVITGFVIGYALASAVGFVVLYRLLAEFPTSDTLAPGYRRRLVEYSIPLTASQSANVLYKRVDTVLIGFFLTPIAVGFYELAKQVTTFLIAPADSIGFTIAPTYGEYKSKGDIDRASEIYERSLEYILLLYLPTVVGVIVLADPLIRLVFGEAFSGAIPALQVLSLFVLFQAIDKITNDSLDYLGRATERAIGKGITGTANVALNVLLIPTIGILGAAISTVICFGAMVGYNLYLIHRELSLDVRSISESVLTTAGIALAMGVIVISLSSMVTGILGLVIVTAVGVVSWSVLSIASGIVRVDQVLANI